MNIPLTFLGAGLSLLFLMALFCPLEKVFPAKKQPFFRPRWWTDLAFFLGQYLLWSGCVLAILRFFRGWLDLAVPGSFRAFISSQPWWLQAIEVVFLSDLFIYWSSIGVQVSGGAMSARLYSRSQRPSGPWTMPRS